MRNDQGSISTEINFLNALFHFSPAMICVIDIDGRIRMINESMLNALGYTLDEVIGKDYIATFIRESEKTDLSDIFKSIINSKKYISNKNHIITKDGRSLLVDWNGCPVLNANGEVDFFFGVGENITESKKNEEALKESERRLGEIIDFLPDPTMAIDLEGRLTVWNKAMEEMTGVRAKDMLGRSNYEYAVPFYGKPRAVLMDLVLSPDFETPGLYNENIRHDDMLITEHCHHHKGKQKWLLGKAAKLFDRKGNVAGAIESIRDITAQKEAEERLKVSEKGYRAIFENTGTATVIVEDDTMITLANSEFCKLTGYSKKELEGRMSWKDVVLPEDVEQYMHYHVQRRKKAGNAPRNYESRICNKTGKIRNVIFTVCMIPGTSRSICSLMDITDRIKAEKNQRKSEERYRLLAENIHDVIWIMTPDMRFTYISPSVRLLTGYTVEEIMDLSPMDYTTLPSNNHAMEIIKKELAREKEAREIRNQPPLIYELELVRKDGSKIWTEITASILYNDHGDPVQILGVARDIMERKKAEQERKIYEKQLQRAQKMEAIGTLAGGIAHDFNNILSPIIGFTELTLEGLPKGGKEYSHLKEVLTAANRAKDLVKQILTFSRGVETSTRPVEMHIVIKEAMKLLQATIPATIEIKLRIDPHSGRILADPTHIHRVIINLCTNAYQSMIGMKGTLTVSLKSVDIDSDLDNHYSAVRRGKYVRLTVKDTGCGMDDSTIKRIFDPFYTTKDKDVGGTGLGLATVHSIVTSLGGAIIVSSKPLQGSTFDVYIPRHIGDAYEEPCPESSVLRGNGECILMVDDEKTILEMGKNMLENLGYKTVVEASSIKALNLFKQNPDRFDCVITDKTMPHMTGEQLACEMLRLRPDLPIILSSGFFDGILQEHIEPMGIRAILKKPYTIQNLAMTVNSTIQDK